MIKRMKKAGAAIVMLGSICVSAITAQAEPAEAYDINVKKIEIAAEANDSSVAAIEAMLKEKEQQLVKEEQLKIKRQLEEEAARAKQEEIEAIEVVEASQPVASDVQTSSYDAGINGVLTKSGGVNYYNGQKETYYSQRVLPGGGLDIPGRHVAADGTIRDEANYIVVASDRQSKGETGICSLGEYKVYDTGVGHDGIDIYTDW